MIGNINFFDKKIVYLINLIVPMIVNFFIWTPLIIKFKLNNIMFNFLALIVYLAFFIICYLIIVSLQAYYECYYENYYENYNLKTLKELSLKDINFRFILLVLPLIGVFLYYIELIRYYDLYNIYKLNFKRKD